MKTRLLQASDVEKIVHGVGLNPLMDKLLKTLESALSDFIPEKAIIPIRDGLHYQNPALGLLEWMPAYLDGKYISIKLVGYHPTNPVLREMPSVISTITLFDARSGHLSGLVDGTFLTALRTGAMSALASAILARPDSRTLGIIGAGAQAVTQAYALSRRFQLERIVVHDVDPDAAASFASRIRFLDIPVETVGRESLEQLLADSDILCTCTSEEPGRGPVFKDLGNKPHLHINAVGSDFHGKTEVPVELLKRSTVCPDFRAQAIHEGECQLLEVAEIGPDLVDLIKEPEAFEHLQDQSTVFDSTGWALADYVVGSLMLELADEVGVGSDLQFECIPSDPKNPFSFMEQSATRQMLAPVAGNRPTSSAS